MEFNSKNSQQISSEEDYETGSEVEDIDKDVENCQQTSGKDLRDWFILKKSKHLKDYIIIVEMFSQETEKPVTIEDGLRSENSVE